jgi:8-oxo-dGTP pyrophosphatase MutT (NUDIX family)
LDPKTIPWRGAYVCVFNEDFSKLLLLKRAADKGHKSGGKWGNVGGSVEPGETPLQACIRETMEETGLILKPENIVSVSIKRGVLYFFATSIPEDTKISINEESERYEWFLLENLPEKTLDKKNELLRWRDRAKSSLRKASGTQDTSTLGHH